MFILAVVVVVVSVTIFIKWLWVVGEIKRKKPRGSVNSTRFQLKSVEVNIDSDFYKRLQKANTKDLFPFFPNLFRESPEDGVEIVVNYIDTQDEDNSNVDQDKPVILALHGIPGSHEDFRHLIDHFGDDYRVLAPNFPDFSFSMATNSFWHSNPERVEFIKQFLKTLNVKTVKSLVCHSASSNVAAAIWSQDLGVTLQSVILIAPPPGLEWVDPFGLKWARRLAKAGRWSFTRNLTFAFWPRFLDKYFGMSPNISKNTTRDDTLLVTFGVVLSEFETKLDDRYELLPKIRLPTLWVVADRDRLVPMKLYKRLFTSFGVTEDHVALVEDDHVFDRKINSDWIRVLRYKTAGHFCFIKFPKPFHQEVANFINSF